MHTEHLKAQRTLEMYKQAQPSTLPKNHTLTPSNTKKTNTFTQSPWNPKTETQSANHTVRGSLPTTNSEATPNQDGMTTNKIATPKPTEIPSKTDSENLPHTLTQETPPTHVSALGSRKRKLMLSVKQSTKKVRKSCSTCGPSPAGMNSVAKRTAKRTALTCSKCMPSLHSYFKPQ